MEPDMIELVSSLEPLYIRYGGNEWGHPETQEFTNGFDDYHSNLIRWSMKFDGVPCYVVTTCSDEAFSSMMSVIYDGGDGVIFHAGFEMLMVCLFEDVWVVGDEQFCFTEFGAGMKYPKNAILEYASPDVCLHVDENTGIFNGFST